MIARPRASLVVAALLLAGLASAAAASDRYAVEFRARSGGLLGHTYVAYGPIDGDGRLHRARYAGFYPSGILSQTPLLAVMVTPASVGAEAWDRTKPTEMVYRRELSARAYTHLDGEVRALRQTRPFWHLVFYNCNSFAADVAESMGLRAPSTLELPKDFVQGLYVLNKRARPRLVYAEAVGKGAGGRVQEAPDMLFLRTIRDPRRPDE